MKATLDTTYKLYSPAEADRIVAEMLVADPEWTYVACHDPKGTGYSFIEIYDEEGEYVSRFNL